MDRKKRKEVGFTLTVVSSMICLPAMAFILCLTSAPPAYAEKRLEVRQEEQCGYVLNEKNVRLGTTTAYITLEQDGRTEDNFKFIDGAVCAFKLANPGLDVTSVYVDQQNARQEAPVILRDRVKGLLLHFNRK